MGGRRDITFFIKKIKFNRSTSTPFLEDIPFYKENPGPPSPKGWTKWKDFIFNLSQLWAPVTSEKTIKQSTWCSLKKKKKKWTLNLCETQMFHSNSIKNEEKPHKPKDFPYLFQVFFLSSSTIKPQWKKSRWQEIH